MGTIKKIVLVGAFAADEKIYTYASSFYKTLAYLGYDVVPFNYRQYSSLHLTNMLLRSAVWKHRPEMVFILKGETVTAQTVAWIKSRCGASVVNFYPDNPFTVWNGNSTDHLLRALPLYDHFLIWSHQLIPILYSAGCKNVSYFPFGFDETLFQKPLANNRLPASCDVCFIGTWDKERERWLTLLRQKMPSIKLAVWGNRWQEQLPHDSLLRDCWRGPACYFDDMRGALQSTKIGLNFIRAQNLDAHNMRTFEIPACKTLLLTQRTREQAIELFHEGQDILCFGTVEELCNKVAWCLDNDRICLEIAASGYKQVQRFTLGHLLHQFLSSWQDTTLIKQKEWHDTIQNQC